jgi:hypothetical protein
MLSCLNTFFTDDQRISYVRSVSSKIKHILPSDLVKSLKQFFTDTGRNIFTNNVKSYLDVLNATNLVDCLHTFFSDDGRDVFIETLRYKIKVNSTDYDAINMCFYCGSKNLWMLMENTKKHYVTQIADEPTIKSDKSRETKKVESKSSRISADDLLESLFDLDDQTKLIYLRDSIDDLKISSEDTPKIPRHFNDIKTMIKAYEILGIDKEIYNLYIDEYVDKNYKLCINGKEENYNGSHLLYVTQYGKLDISGPYYDCDLVLTVNNKNISSILKTDLRNKKIIVMEIGLIITKQ